MKNLWNEKNAKKYISEYAKKRIKEDLALRIYTTHLLGNQKKLVLHGAVNTTDVFFTQIFLKKNIGNIITVDGGNISASLK